MIPLRLETAELRMIASSAVGRYISTVEAKINTMMIIHTYSNHLVDKSSNLDLTIQNT
jgi:hypothetical protein